MFMEQRRAHRIPCELPIRIYGPGADIDAQIHDVSRTGLRIRVPLAALGSLADHDMLDLARAVDQHMGAWFNMDLNHEELGPLVRKRVRLVRLGETSKDTDVLELGCEFGVPLSNDESSVLDLDLPALDAPVPLQVRSGPRPRRYAAYLNPSNGWHGRRLAGTTPGLRDGGAVFCADSGSGLGLQEVDVTTIARALAGAYGPRPVLEILQGTQCVWAGPTRIRQVEAAPAPSREMRVGVEAVGCPLVGE
ncbi:MAG: PilZ domain-containing protein [Planctomycetota bacterium]|nr:PilZ domain-containing protein [Planctomycetota bacterium]